MASSSYSKTLQFITSVKLRELSKQRQAFQSHIRVLDEAKVTSDSIAKVELLLKAANNWPGVLSNNVVKGTLDLANLKLWLQSSKARPRI